MDTPMLQQLREYLANTSPEQKELDWAAVKAKGLSGPAAKDFVSTFRFTPPYQQTNTEAFKTALPHLQELFSFDLQTSDANYAMAA